MTDELRFNSIELPWKDNKSNISCIPAGEYKAIWQYSPTFKRMTYRLLDVPGRSGILLHAGNYAGDQSLGYRSDYRGCIGLGMRMGYLGSQLCALDTVTAVRKFETHMAEEPFILQIKWGSYGANYSNADI